MSGCKDFLVVWQDCGEVMQSKVTLPEGTDPAGVLTDKWVRLAAATEGYTEAGVDTLMSTGYGLFLVCDFPETFYV